MALVIPVIQEILRAHKNADPTYSIQNVYILFKNMCLRLICAESPGTDRTGIWFCFKNLYTDKQKIDNFPRPQYCHCSNFLTLLQQSKMRDDLQRCVDNNSTMTGRLLTFHSKGVIYKTFSAKKSKLGSATPRDSQVCFTLYWKLEQ